MQAITENKALEFCQQLLPPTLLSSIPDHQNIDDALRARLVLLAAMELLKSGPLSIQREAVDVLAQVLPILGVYDPLTEYVLATLAALSLDRTEDHDLRYAAADAIDRTLQETVLLN